MLRQAMAWVAVVAVLATIVGGLGYYKYSEISAAIAASEAFPEPRETVAAAVVEAGTWAATTRAVGTVVAVRQVEIRNELAGTVAELGFASGDVVEAGQMLVRLDSRDEEAALAAAEAEQRLAELVFDRRERLRSSPAVAVEELDRAQSELAAARASVERLQVAISKKTLTAPFRARVGLTDLQPGAYLDEGTVVASLQGIDPDVFVDFSLAQDTAALLAPGSTVTVHGPALPGGAADAEIVAEDASIDALNRAIRFRAVVRGQGAALRPGAFVDVVAPIRPPEAVLMVPLTAVRRASYGSHVFVLVEEDGALRARQRNIETGAIVGDRIVVTDGLELGERIAGAGSFKLREGLLVVLDPAATS